MLLLHRLVVTGVHNNLRNPRLVQCFTGVMMCLAACDLSLASSSVEAEACKPIWEDDFQGDLDTANWNVIEGDGCALGLCGWGNRELQTYDARAVSVANGLLSLTAFVDDEGTIRSGRLTTEAKHGFQYGLIEARMRLPAGRGLWPAFWMMPENKQFRWPLEGEIDILEWTGNEPHRIIGAIHFGDLPPGNVHYSETLRTPSVWNGEFHTFGLEWSPQQIRWYVDGREHGVATPDEAAPWPWVFDSKPFHLILNVAVGGTLGGDVVRDDLPATLDVDWVRVYPPDCSEMRFQGSEAGVRAE